jgi:hypothetical protein
VLSSMKISARVFCNPLIYDSNYWDGLLGALPLARARHPNTARRPRKKRGPLVGTPRRSAFGASLRMLPPVSATARVASADATEGQRERGDIMPDTKKLTAADLRQFTGTEQPDHTATLTCDDGNDRIVFTKPIEYTDFPLPEIALYFANNTILLPSEY